MSGLPDFNYPAFMRMAKILREQGHDVFNPAETAGGDTTLPRSFYMRAAIGGLLNAEGVVCLEDWESSAGARIEVGIARELGLKVLFPSDFEPRERIRVDVPDSPDD